jgi:hypothetical protein
VLVSDVHNCMVLKFVLLKARELMLSAAEVVPTLALGVLW